MNVHEIAILTAMAVAAVRQRAPKLDGWLVLVVALLLAVLVAELDAGDGEVRRAALRGIQAAVEAVGGVALLGYGAAKVGAAMTPAPSSEEPRS